MGFLGTAGSGENNWKSYSNYASQLGVTGLSLEDFLNQYKKEGDVDNIDTGAWLRDIGNEGKSRYNAVAQEYAKLSGNAYSPYGGKPTIESASDLDALVQGYQNLASQKQYVEANAPEKEPEYKFEMPSEWTDIETIAQKEVNAGKPTFDATATKTWTNAEGTGYLDALYKPVEEKLARQQKSTWAQLFPYGGGTGKQASNDLTAFKDLNTDKLSRAIDFAKADYAQKIADYTAAQDRLSGIGQFKAQADQFKSSSDAGNYWNALNLGWQQNQFNQGIAQENLNWQRQSDLSKYLAEIMKPDTSNDWMLPASNIAAALLKFTA